MSIEHILANTKKIEVSCYMNEGGDFFRFASLKQLSNVTGEPAGNLIERFHLLDVRNAKAIQREQLSPSIQIFDPDRLVFPLKSLDEVKTILNTDDVAVDSEWAVNVVGLIMSGVDRIEVQETTKDEFPEMAINHFEVYIPERGKALFAILALDIEGNPVYPSFS